MADTQASLLEIDNDISLYHNKLLEFPRLHPLRSLCLLSLAMVRLRRYRSSNEGEDLNKSISHSTEAILLQHDTPIQLGSYVIEILFRLANALLLRSLKLEQPDDVKHAVKYLRYLQDKSLETPSSYAALAAQVELESVDPTRDIREAVTLCLELFSSDVSESPLIHAVEALADAIALTLVPFGKPPPDEAIEYLREARIRFPYLDRAMSILDEIIADPNGNVEQAMNLAGTLARTRFAIDSKPEHLAEAIFRIRTFLNAISPEHPNRDSAVVRLADLEKRRFKHFGVRSVRQGDDAEVVDDSPLAASPQMAKSNLVEIPLLMPDRKNPHPHLLTLHSMRNVTDLTNIERGMEYCRLCLTSPHSHLFFTPLVLGDLLYHVPTRFSTSCLWTQAARVFRHSSILNAYETAISLMQESLSFAPTLEIQHFRLVSMRDQYQKLPLDYASYLVQIGQLKQAIEILERGRGLLWSEMRGLRTSIDQLRAVNLHLAQAFAAVNQDLEVLTISGSPVVRMGDGQVGGHEGMDPFGRLVVKQRKLVEERDGLISQIRAQPGFDIF
ncbi:hypothetical protein BJV74DRAFT_795650 [Russula compacta]|nr:hypothetical protein BJV74DRAFT_795650 [Russula compacta]